MLIERDVVVIGGGGAAVRAALEARLAGAGVVLVDKGRFERSGTSPRGLHGITTVLHPTDSEAILAADIERVGSYVNDLDLVQAAVEAARTEPEALERFGVRFLRQTDGSYDFYRGAGHSAPHGLTFEEGRNGVNFVAVLGKAAWKAGVELLDGVMVTDLVVVNGRVTGAVGIDSSGEVYEFSAGAVVLAAGGANRLYPNVVPRIADPMYRTTGDGYALALRAGLPLVDMEFANFRETPPAARIGRYVNAKGEAFMEEYDPIRLDRAPRGKVVEALYLEMKRGNGPIHIELSPDSEREAAVLPQEYKDYVRAAREGKPPPVTITFQRLLGGARINPDSSTSLEGLFIAGENAGGFHGADRLQGAAFLETQVFGRLAGAHAAKYSQANLRCGGLGPQAAAAVNRIRRPRASGHITASSIIKGVQDICWDVAGIARNGKDLACGLKRLAELRGQVSEATSPSLFERLECENLLYTAEAVVRAALAREETRGTHRRSDFPGIRSDLDHTHTSVSLKADGSFEVALVPARPHSHR